MSPHPEPPPSWDQERRRDLAELLGAIWPVAAGLRDRPEALGDFVDLDSRRLRTDGRALQLPQSQFGSFTCDRNVDLAQNARVYVAGGGIVLECVDKEIDPSMKPLQYALKVPRVSVFVREGKDFESELKKVQREMDIQLSLSHPNVARMRFRGRIEVKDWVRLGHPTVPLPVMLIEWIESAGPIAAFIQKERRPVSNLIDVTEQVLEGIDHIHRGGYTHWDIKSDNILVGSTKIAKVADLGNARPLGNPGGPVETSERNLPPELAVLGGDGSANRLLIDPGVRWVGTQIDLYMLGRELNRLIVASEGALELDAHLREPIDVAELKKASEDWLAEAIRSPLDSFHLECLRLFVRRLLGPDCNGGGGPNGSGYYPDATTALEELRRIRPAFGAADDTPELQSDPQQVLRLPPEINVPWTERVRWLAELPAMRRVRGHRQLATVHLVYAGAEHNRWEHSLGTFEAAVGYVRALFADRANPFFRMGVAAGDIDALLVAALLHDVGHPAMGHQLEESVFMAEKLHEEYFLEVIREASGALKDGSSEVEPGARQERVDGTELASALGRFWSAKLEALDLLDRVRTIMHPPDVEPSLDSPELHRESSDALLLQVLSSIVSGGMDADKFDYLRRDAHHLGVRYAEGVDRLRLFQALTTVSVANRASIGVTEKGSHPLEALVLARYHMFAAVYWHKSVRALTALLVHVVDTFIFPRAPAPGVAGFDPVALGQLADSFRRLPDDEALAWLQTELPTRLGGDELQVCEEIVTTLRGATVSGDRQGLYWTVLELWSRVSEHERADSETGLIDATYWSAVGEIEECAKATAGADGVRGTAFLRERRALDARFLKHLEAAIPVAGQWRPGDAILDIPRRVPGQTEGLYVHMGGSHEVRALSDVTPLGRAVDDAFSRSVRRVRVFLSPKAVGSLLADGMRPNTIESAVLDALQRALKYERAVPPRRRPGRRGDDSQKALQ